jgi:hypothetical protein
MCKPDFDTQSDQHLASSGPDDIAGEIRRVATAGNRLARGQSTCQCSFCESVVLDELKNTCNEGIYLTNKAHVTDSDWPLISDSEGRGEHVPRTQWFRRSNGNIGLESVSSGHDSADYA